MENGDWLSSIKTHIKVECPIEIVRSEFAEMCLYTPQPVRISKSGPVSLGSEKKKTDLVPDDGRTGPDAVQASKEREDSVDDERNLLPQVGQDFAAYGALSRFRRWSARAPGLEA